MNYIMTIMSLFTADTIIKYNIEQRVNIGEEKEILAGKLLVKNYHNTGAAFNIGRTKPNLIAKISLVFSIFTTGIFAAVMRIKGNRLLKTGISVLLGGAYSNTYDRLVRKYVVDYFSVRLPETDNRFLRKLKSAVEGMVFNISDLGIAIGALILMIYGLIKKEK